MLRLLGLLSLARAAAEPAVRSEVALVTGARTLTYAELAALSARARAGLADRGVGQGTRVAVRARNDEATVALVHALIDLGATFVPIHPRLTEGEARDQIADADPALVLGEDDLPSLVACTKEPPPLAEIAGETPLAIVYTSGTTGRAKGAVLTRRAFAASAEASSRNLGWRPDDRWLMCMPVCHVGGLSILTRTLLARRAVILLPRFDPPDVLRAIREREATLMSVVPTMLAALLDADDHDHLASLRATLSGGAGTPFALLQRCHAKRVVALTTYGLTEACSQVTAQSLSSINAYRPRRGSGAPLAGTSLRIFEGPIGRIQIRGPTLMEGYFAGEGLPPRRALDEDGWLETGDLGEIDDDGQLHVHARRSDLIVTGGENVYPVDVEQRLMTIDGVRDALVFGVPDDRWGQIVAAALVLAPGVTLATVATSAPRVLAPYKRPRLVCAVDDLPLTSSGKVQRAGVVERYRAMLAPFPAPSPPSTDR